MTGREELAKWARMLRGMQPGAWLREEFVVRAGFECVAQPLPPGVPRGRPKECFRNARALARRRRGLTYCEGFVLGLAIPIHHAWAIDGERRVIDPTLGRPEQFAFVGVPISPEELAAFTPPGSLSVLTDWRECTATGLIYHRCPELQAEAEASARGVAAVLRVASPRCAP